MIYSKQERYPDGYEALPKTIFSAGLSAWNKEFKQKGKSQVCSARTNDSSEMSIPV